MAICMAKEKYKRGVTVNCYGTLDKHLSVTKLMMKNLNILLVSLMLVSVQSVPTEIDESKGKSLIASECSML